MMQNSTMCLDLRTHYSKSCQGLSTSHDPIVVSKKLYSRFVDYTTENARIGERAEKEMEKLSQLKEASYEMTKDWNDTIKNVSGRRREYFLMKRKKIEDANIKFGKNIVAKNAAERAEIVKAARKLLFYKKPECRAINSALLTAETYRELHAQLALRKKLRAIEIENENMYAELLKKDTEDYFREENLKTQERLKRTQNYAIELKRQIEDTSNTLKKLNLYDTKADRKDLENMQKESKMIEECEKELIRRNKDYLKNMFLDQLNEKKRGEEILKEEEDIQNHCIEAYRSAKEHLMEIAKQKLKAKQEDNIKRSEMLVKKCAAAFEINKMKEDERLGRAVAEKAQIEAEKGQAKRQIHDKMRADMKRYEVEVAALKLKREEEEKNLFDWETHQRYKRDEYNKEMELKAAQQEAEKKKEMAEFLKKQMAERDAARKMERIMDDNSQEMENAIQRENQRILAYGKEVLEESKDVRPLFPIIKAIENFKRENRLVSPTSVKEYQPLKCRQKVKKIRSNSTPLEQIFCLG